MPSFKSLSATVLAATLMASAPAHAAMKTETQKVARLPGIAGYYKLTPAEKSQFGLYYAVRVKNASLADVTATLNDGGKTIPVHFGADGRIDPMPTREQVASGATITVTYPSTATTAMKIKIYSTQPVSRNYDTASLVLGLRQANKAMTKIGGPLAAALPRLDRVYFVGARSGTVDNGGDAQPLPTFRGDKEIPAGTPYFEPSQASGATTIRLGNLPSGAFLATSPD